MFIRILMCFLLVSACTSGDLRSRVDENVAEATPQPAPTDSGNSEAECLKTCAEACEDYGEWSAWSPATDTVCENSENQLTQSRSRTRTCKATCPDVQCMTTEDEKKDVDGTKQCITPPPPCKTSCSSGCQAKTHTAWSPTEQSQCQGVKFTQARKWERQCFPTCDDKADCLCTGVQCDTEGPENQDATGTKAIDCSSACEAYTYGSWSPSKDAAEVCQGQSVAQTRQGTRTCPRDNCSVCDKTKTTSRTLNGTKVTPCQADSSPYCNAWQAVSGAKWSPASDTQTQGTEFKQTRQEERTCPRVCPDSACKTERTAQRDAVGTKAPPVVEPPVTTPPPPPPPPPPTCEPSCSSGCQAWQDWAWTAVTSCPTTIDFGVKLPVERKEQRARTRTCNDLCTDVKCFTSNAETRTTPCTCPTGKVLADDGTCVCDSKSRKYQVGNECQQCPSDYNFKKVDDIWTCKPTTCGDCCTDWVQQSVSQQASEVCQNSQFTPLYTYARTCSNCYAGVACSLTKEEPAAEPVQGTKTTKNCAEHCTAWSALTWKATKACPADTSFTKSTATYAGERTRTCTGLCDEADCDEVDRTSRTQACPYCQGTGQEKINVGTDFEKCACDADKNYYRSGDTCKLCSAPKILEDGACVTPPTECLPPKVLKDGACVPPKPTPKAQTCADGCGEWNLSAWTWTLPSDEDKKCPTDQDAFTKPTLEAEQATRTRTRTCENLQEGLQCFTANTEIRTTACKWCEGDRQELDENGVCVCKHTSGYRRVGEECQQCPAGQQLVESDNTWTCAAVASTTVVGPGTEPETETPPPPSCDQACVAWTAWGEWSQAAADVCSGTEFTPARTRTRTCPPDRSDCLKSETEKGAKHVGMKTIDCDKDCGAWSEYGPWTADIPCPASTRLGSKPPTITERQTRTRTCGELCGQECDTSESRIRPRFCPCTGEGQTQLFSGECVELPTGGQPPSGSGSSGSTPSGSTPSESTTEVIPPSCHKTCADGCEDWEAWQDWQHLPDKDCPAKSAFTAPSEDTVKSRARQRSCAVPGEFCEDVTCFTDNTESQTCEWCKGEGQKLDGMGVCVCDRERNYFKTTNGDAHLCMSCGNKIVNAVGDGCVCAEKSSTENEDRKEWNSDTCTWGCKGNLRNECMGKGSFNTDTCECTETQATLPPIHISINHRCFTYDTGSILHLPSGYDNGKGLKKVLPDNQKWKFTQCFDGDIDEYNKAFKAINSQNEGVQDAIQKFYNCASNTAGDKGNVRRAKADFVDQLRFAINRGRDCQSHSADINVDITPSSPTSN